MKMPRRLYFSGFKPEDVMTCPFCRRMKFCGVGENGERSCQSCYETYWANLEPKEIIE